MYVVHLITYVAYRPKFNVLATLNFDVGTTGVDRRCIDVVYTLSNVATIIISTYFQRRNDVGVPAGAQCLEREDRILLLPLRSMGNFVYVSLLLLS